MDSTQNNLSGQPPATGWYWTDNHAVDRMAVVGTTAFSVYDVLIRFSSSDRVCSVSRNKIAETVGVSPRTVATAIETLKEHGLVEVSKRHGAGGIQLCNQYHILDLSPHDQGEADCMVGGSGLHGEGEADCTPINKTFLKQEKEFVVCWNKTGGVRKCRGKELTDSRRRAFRARLKAEGWLDDFHLALTKFPLPCTTTDPDGWKPDVDWILKPDSVTKVLEEKYDWTPNNASGKPEQPKQELKYRD